MNNVITTGTKLQAVLGGQVFIVIVNHMSGLARVTIESYTRDEKLHFTCFINEVIAKLPTTFTNFMLQCAIVSEERIALIKKQLEVLGEFDSDTFALEDELNALEASVAMNFNPDDASWDPDEVDAYDQGYLDIVEDIEEYLGKEK